MTPHPPESFETTRILARRSHVDDATALFAAYCADPEVARFMTWQPHQSAAQTLEFLQHCDVAWSTQSAFLWVLRLKSDGECVGVLEGRLRPGALELGYTLGRPWWGKGLMHEAAGALVQWGLQQPDIYRVWATCDVENDSSARLLERLGMQREGVLRRWIVHPNLGDTPRDCLCYAIVKP